MKETGVGFLRQRGSLYKCLGNAASEARRLNLLINPNPFTSESHSAAVGNPDNMMPSSRGWEMTKGILWRHVINAQRNLDQKLQSSAWS